MNEDDRALLIADGEDPDDPRIIAAYEYMETALALYTKVHRRMSPRSR
ncbi:hypothetical protein [Rhodococcus baikonurensis]|uniref:Uncharacterized protein n=1 Tax=Rhodococcus baikonurensis TaxID=172041 RepID=A0ABV5XPV6_9NOCA